MIMSIAGDVVSHVVPMFVKKTDKKQKKSVKICKFKSQR